MLVSVNCYTQHEVRLRRYITRRALRVYLVPGVFFSSLGMARPTAFRRDIRYQVPFFLWGEDAAATSALFDRRLEVLAVLVQCLQCLRGVCSVMYASFSASPRTAVGLRACLAFGCSGFR